jgi:hypothetical protein
MSIPISIPRQSIRDKVVSLVQAALNRRTEAGRLLDESKLAVERLVLKGIK